MKKNKRVTEVIISFLIVSLLTTGCKNLFGGDFSVKFIPEEETRDNTESGVNIVINYQADDTIGDAKYISEYPNAFYIPEDYSLKSEDVKLFQFLDFINGDTFVYMYQTYIYDEDVSEDILGDADGDYTMNSSVKVTTRNRSDKMVTVLAAYDYTQKSEAGYVELVKLESDENNAVSAYATTMVDGQGAESRVTGYGIFYDRAIRIFDAEKVAQLVKLKPEERSQAKLDESLLVSYGGYGADGSYDEESTKLNKMIVDRLAQEFITFPIYEMDVSSVSFYTEVNDGILMYEALVQFACSKEVSAEKEDDKAAENILKSAADEEMSEEELDEWAANAEREANTKYFTMTLDFSPIDNTYFKAVNNNYYNEDYYFSTNAGKNSERTSESAPYDNGTNGTNGLVTYEQTMSAYAPEYSQIELLSDSMLRANIKLLDALGGNVDLYCPVRYLYTDDYETPSWIGTTNPVGIKQTFALSKYTRTDLGIWREDKSDKWLISGTVHVGNINSHTSKMYYKYTYTKNVNGTPTATEVKGRLETALTESITYYIGEANIIHFNIEQESSDRKQQYLVNTIGVEFEDKNYNFYDEVTDIEKQKIESNRLRYLFRNRIEKKYLDKGKTVDNIRDISTKIVNGQVYCYVITSNKVDIWTYTGYSFDLVKSFDLKKLNLKAIKYNASQLDEITKGYDEQLKDDELYDEVKDKIPDWISAGDVAAGIDSVTVNADDGSQQDRITCIFGEQYIYFNNLEGKVLVAELPYEDVVKVIRANNKKNSVSKESILANNEMLLKIWDKPSTSEWKNLRDTVLDNLHWAYGITFSTNIDGDIIINIDKGTEHIGELKYKSDLGKDDNTFDIDELIWSSILAYVDSIMNSTEGQMKRRVIGGNTPEVYTNWKLSYLSGDFMGKGAKDYWLSSTVQNSIIVLDQDDNYQPVFQKNLIVETTKKSASVNEAGETEGVKVEKVNIQQLTRMTDGVAAYAVLPNSYNKLVDGLSYDYFFLGFDMQDAVYTNEDIIQAKVIPFTIIKDYKKYNLEPSEGENVVYLLQDMYDYKEYPGLLQYEGYRSELPTADEYVGIEAYINN